MLSFPSNLPGKHNRGANCGDREIDKNERMPLKETSCSHCSVYAHQHRRGARIGLRARTGPSYPMPAEQVALPKSKYPEGRRSAKTFTPHRHGPSSI
jgi:hypothetical protein